MLENSASMIDIVLLPCSLGMLVVICILISKYRNLEQKFRNQMTFLKQELNALSQSSVGVGKRLSIIDCEQQKIKQRQRSLENLARQPSYEQVCRLIELGATQDDLINHCGLPRNEAELITSLINKPRSKIKLRSVT